MTTNTTAPCPCVDLAQEGDDDRMLNFLKDIIIPALTPRKFVVTIEIAAAAPFTTVKALVDQYRSILDIPLTEPTQEELISELRDLASTIENLSNLIFEDIDTIFETDEAFFPKVSDAKLIGIEMDRSIVVADG